MDFRLYRKLSSRAKRGAPYFSMLGCSSQLAVILWLAQSRKAYAESYFLSEPASSILATIARQLFPSIPIKDLFVSEDINLPKGNLLPKFKLKLRLDGNSDALAKVKYLGSSTHPDFLFLGGKSESLIIPVDLLYKSMASVKTILKPALEYAYEYIGNAFISYLMAEEAADSKRHTEEQEEVLEDEGFEQEEEYFAEEGISHNASVPKNAKAVALQVISTAPSQSQCPADFGSSSGSALVVFSGSHAE